MCNMQKEELKPVTSICWEYHLIPQYLGRLWRNYNVVESSMLSSWVFISLDLCSPFSQCLWMAVYIGMCPCSCAYACIVEYMCVLSCGWWRVTLVSFLRCRSQGLSLSWETNRLGWLARDLPNTLSPPGIVSTSHYTQPFFTWVLGI